MRKLIVLKSLIDFIWILTCIPTALILGFYAIYMFVNPESLIMVVGAEDDLFETSTIAIQLFVLLFIVLGFVSIYCVFLFRKTLRYFQKVKPFHSDVIENFYKIGYLLSGIGIVASILFFLSRLFFKSEVKISLGFSPYLMIICLGLFFLVLSEVFKVAKHAKEENDLTI